jgi:hypothetical protein
MAANHKNNLNDLLKASGYEDAGHETATFAPHLAEVNDIIS